MKAQQLDSASAVRIAALVVREEEGRRKFATFLRKIVPAVWETGLKDWKPARRPPYDPFPLVDVAKPGRELVVAIKAAKADQLSSILMKGFRPLGKPGPTLNDLFDKLEGQLQQVLPIVEALYSQTKKIGRPKQPFKDGFELFVGRVLIAITWIGGQPPTCNKHHQSGTLVDLLVALRPYLPPNFVPEHLDKWPWPKLERLLSAKNLRDDYAVRRKSFPI